MAGHVLACLNSSSSFTSSPRTSATILEQLGRIAYEWNSGHGRYAGIHQVFTRPIWFGECSSQRYASVSQVSYPGLIDYPPTQYAHLKIGVAEVFLRRENPSLQGRHHEPQMSYNDKETTREVFWDLFRQGVIMIGADDANEKFPFFSLTSYGRKLLDGADPYFFYDVESFEKRVRTEIPKIDDITLTYLKESMQAFRAGCILSCSVMLGVATEHAFLSLMDVIDNNAAYKATYAPVSQTWMILTKVTKFKSILEQHHLSSLNRDTREDLEINFTGILSVIRNYRNQSGHPTGKIISREQAYVLMQLFIPYCKKIYQLRDHFA